MRIWTIGIYGDYLAFVLLKLSLVKLGWWFFTSFV